MQVWTVQARQSLAISLEELGFSRPVLVNPLAVSYTHLRAHET